MMNDEIDCEKVLNFDDGAENFDFFAAASPPFPATEVSESVVPATARVDSWMGELESLLMKDDDVNNNGGCETINNDYFHEFDLEVCDLMLEFPESGENEGKNSPSSEPEVLNVEVDDNKSSPSIENGGHRNVDKENSPNFESNCENDKSSDDGVGVNDDDPLSKKRKRQSSNREAAIRSRERKKMLVKELEMKSRYFEEECRRLQRLLHCCYTENQWLRCSLQTYGAQMTKPESAVLLLESLLLGSLVWLMVNICLLPQPKLALLNQDAAVLISADRKVLETAAPRGKGTKISELWMSLSFTRSKRCRASRTKMKSYSPLLCF